MKRSTLAAPRWATAWLLLCLALAVPGSSWAQGGTTSALDLVYEASDAIDEARSQLEAGRQREADRLLNRAERFLDEAARLAPDLRRVQFERARLLQADGDPSRAEGMLLSTMYASMSPRDHIRAVTVLDDIRGDLRKPTIGAKWQRTTALRNVGIATIAAGAVTALIGFGAGFDALAQDTYSRAENPDLTPRQAGLALALTGVGIAGVGGSLTVAGEFGRGKLRFVLPGPWRLPGGRLEAGSDAPKPRDSQRPRRELR